MYRNADGVFQVDFVIRGNRVQRDTKTKDIKKAKAIERELREEMRKGLDQIQAHAKEPLKLDAAVRRYWDEHGQHHANDADTHRNLTNLIKFFGATTRMDEITDREVAALVAFRAGQTVHGKRTGKDGKPMRLVSPATVNRTTTQPLKYLFGRAKNVWRYNFPNEPNWRQHLREEAGERIRELHAWEGEVLDGNVRPDYAAWLEFARLTGRRLAETLIRWSEVDWETGRIVSIGKKRKPVITQITAPVRDLLKSVQGHDSEWVFTYVANRASQGKVRGQRYAITYEGAKTEWRRLVARGGLTNLRLHDLRHDFCSKLLRQSGNLKLTQKAMNHSDIKTTMRYAHVLDSDIREELEAFHSQRRKLPANLPATENRNS